MASTLPFPLNIAEEQRRLDDEAKLRLGLDPNYGTRTYTPPRRPIRKGIEHGLLGLEQGLDFTLAAAAQASNVPQVQASSLNRAAQIDQQIGQYGGVTDWKQIKSGADMAEWFAYNVATQAPLMLEVAVAATVGAAAGPAIAGGMTRKALKKEMAEWAAKRMANEAIDQAQKELVEQTFEQAAKVYAGRFAKLSAQQQMGARVAGFGALYPSSVGEVYQETVDAGQPSPGTAFGVGAFHAGLEWTPFELMGRMYGGMAKAVAAKAAEGIAAKELGFGAKAAKAAKGGLKVGLAEVAEEDLQQLTTLAVRAKLNPTYTADDLKVGQELWDTTINAAPGSFLFGLLGAGAAAHGAGLKRPGAEKPLAPAERHDPLDGTPDPLVEKEMQEENEAEIDRMLGILIPPTPPPAPPGSELPSTLGAQEVPTTAAAPEIEPPGAPVLPVETVVPGPAGLIPPSGAAAPVANVPTVAPPGVAGPPPVAPQGMAVPEPAVAPAVTPIVPDGGLPVLPPGEQAPAPVAVEPRRAEKKRLAQAQKVRTATKQETPANDRQAGPELLREERVGKEPGGAVPEPAAGEEAPPAGGVLQAQGKKVAAPGRVGPEAEAEVQTIAGKMSLGEFEAKGYAPEQVTRQNWVDLQRAERRRLGQSEESGTPFAPYADYEEYHRQAVKGARARGEDIDEEVIADYPELSTTPPAAAEIKNKGVPEDERAEVGEPQGDEHGERPVVRDGGRREGAEGDQGQVGNGQRAEVRDRDQGREEVAPPAPPPEEGERVAPQAKPEAPTFPGPTVAEIDAAGDDKAERHRLWVAKGNAALPGIRQQDAAYYGRLAYVIERGDATMDEWDKQVAEAHRENRMLPPESVPKPKTPQQEYDAAADEFRKVSKAHREITEMYRAKSIDEQSFLVSRKELNEAQAAMDAAEAKFLKATQGDAAPKPRRAARKAAERAAEAPAAKPAPLRRAAKKKAAEAPPAPPPPAAAEAPAAAQSEPSIIPEEGDDLTPSDKDQPALFARGRTAARGETGKAATDFRAAVAAVTDRIPFAGENVRASTFDKAPEKVKRIVAAGEGQAARGKEESIHVDRTRIRQLGYTSDLREAGYITPDGRLIDLSGKREGGTAGTRSFDHREVGGQAGMLEFMREGNIRINGDLGQIDISAPPTREQMRVIDRIVSKDPTTVVIDLPHGIGKWNESQQRYENDGTIGRESIEPDERTIPRKILNDIRGYYGQPKFYRGASGEIRAVTLGTQSYFFLDRYESQEQLERDIAEEAGHRLVNELGGDEWLAIGEQTYEGNWNDIAKEIDRNYPYKRGSVGWTHELVAKALRDGKNDVGLLQRFLDAVVAAVKRAMKRLGLTLNLSDAEVRDFLNKALERKAAMAAGGARVPGAALPMGIFVASNAILTQPGGPVVQHAIQGFHGTPHTMEPEPGAPLGKFKKEKVGTGEGAAAYGWGVAYVAGNKDVADQYRKSLSIPEVRVMGQPMPVRSWRDLNPQDWVWRRLSDARIDLPNSSSREIAERLLTRINEDAEATSLTDAERNAIEDRRGILIEAMRRGLEVEKGGNLYHVEILADDEDLLDWDLLLNEQSEKVKQIAQSISSELDADLRSARRSESEADIAPFRLGNVLYHHFVSVKGGARAASEYLASLGIKGIRYADQGSRGKKEKTYNYVIFSEDDLNVVGRNGERLTPTQAMGRAVSAAKGEPESTEPAFFARAGEPITPEDKAVYGDPENMIKGGAGAIKSFLRRQTPKALAAFSRRHLLQMFEQVLPPAMAPLAKTHDQTYSLMGAEVNRRQSNDNDLYLRWIKLKKNQMQLSLDTITDATFYQVHPDGEYAAHPEQDEAEKNLPAVIRTIEGMKRSGAERTPLNDKQLNLLKQLTYRKEKYERIVARPKVHARLKNTFDNLMSEENRQIYRDVIANYRQKKADTIAELNNKVTAMIEDTQQEAGEDGEAKRKVIMSSIQAEFDKYLNDDLGPYAPISRFGDQVVVVKENGAVVSMMKTDSPQKADALKKALEADGYTVHVTVQKDYSASLDGVSSEAVVKIMQAVEDQLGKTPATAQLMDTINQIFLSSQPDMAFRKHYVHRIYRRGGSRDAVRSFLDHSVHSAHHISTIKYGHVLQRQLNVIEDAITEIPDRRLHQTFINELKKRFDMAMQPQFHPLAQMAAGFAFMMSIGPSPAAAIVNLTQTAIFTFPYLGARYGWRRAAKALLAAANDLRLSKTFSLAKGGWDLEAADDKVIPPRVKALMKLLYEDGSIDITQTNDMTGASRRDVATNQKGKAYRVAMMAASFPFHIAEVFNRQVTGIATARLALADNAEIDDEALHEAASDAIKDTHGDYSRLNRPRISEGALPRVLTIFKQYAYLVTVTMGKAFYDSLRGATPEVRHMAQKQFAGHMLMGLGFSGVAGLWGFGAVNAAIKAISAPWRDDDEPWDLEKYLRELLAKMGVGQKPAEIAMRGLPRMIPWGDIANRVQLTDLWGGGNMESTATGRRRFYEDLAFLAGPIAGQGANFYDAYEEMQKGQWLRGIEHLTPKFARDVFRTARFAKEGIRTKGEEPIVTDLSLLELMGQATGFTPARAAEAYNVRRQEKMAETARTETRSDIVSRYVQAEIKRDAGARIKVARARDAYNRKHPGEPITRADLRAAVKRRMTARAGNSR